ncbi:MAG: thiol reductase thioredoxin [Planctomycetota bacterium]|nr:MAG: thiol reductase thioredoxin [Planctomycetota bacterium]REJ92663.1 MAG: thiol reductase thioredoxin [Planctomycetota bacterium]REK23698.1 MAG: thiol reductase thioredoxin [Planctomycetota bacterium]REK47552.1 MAG: thiol reductase thioredoxin [Planctomycetota bacterium]
MINFSEYFQGGYDYEAFLEKYGKPGERERWNAMHARIELTDAQRALLAGFTREMKVLVMAGTWCGDCVEQCPIFAHFAAASPRIQLRFVDRDEAAPAGAVALSDELLLCGAPRVPQVVFISEDDHPVARYGDRTLAKYRDMAATLGGAACPSGIGGPVGDLLAATVQEWLDEFERAQLILRTSGRLRNLHGD